MGSCRSIMCVLFTEAMEGRADMPVVVVGLAVCSASVDPRQDVRDQWRRRDQE